MKRVNSTSRTKRKLPKYEEQIISVWCSGTKNVPCPRFDHVMSTFCPRDDHVLSIFFLKKL